MRRGGYLLHFRASYLSRPRSSPRAPRLLSVPELDLDQRYACASCPWGRSGRIPHPRDHNIPEHSCPCRHPLQEEPHDRGQQYPNLRRQADLSSPDANSQASPSRQIRGTRTAIHELSDGDAIRPVSDRRRISRLARNACADATHLALRPYPILRPVVLVLRLPRGCRASPRFRSPTMSRPLHMKSAWCRRRRRASAATGLHLGGGTPNILTP